MALKSDPAAVEDDPVAAAIALAERTCPPWAVALTALAGSVRDRDAVAEKLAPLGARQEGDVLHVIASDPFSANWVREKHAATIAHATGLRVEVSP